MIFLCNDRSNQCSFQHHSLFCEILQAPFSSENCLRKVKSISLEWRFYWWKHGEEKDWEVTAEDKRVSRSHMPIVIVSPVQAKPTDWWNQLNSTQRNLILTPWRNQGVLEWMELILSYTLTERIEFLVLTIIIIVTTRNTLTSIRAPTLSGRAVA